MATYKETQTWVKENYGFTPKTCWIAHVKYLEGLPVRKAPNRIGVMRSNPCPEKRREPIIAALHYFKIKN